MATAPPDQPPSSTDERIGEEVDPFSMQGNVDTQAGLQNVGK